MTIDYAAMAAKHKIHLNRLLAIADELGQCEIAPTEQDILQIIGMQRKAFEFFFEASLKAYCGYYAAMKKGGEFSAMQLVCDLASSAADSIINAIMPRIKASLQTTRASQNN